MRAWFGWIVAVVIIFASIFFVWTYWPEVALKNTLSTPQNTKSTEIKNRDITFESIYPGYRLEKTADFAVYEDFLESRGFWEMGQSLNRTGQKLPHH